MAETVFSGVASDIDVQGALFQGIKFWISHKVPQRSRFLSDIKVNGGEILPLEKHADVKIVDHARKETPPGSHSYTFIEKSIRNGVLEDLDDHKVGPPEGNIRNIGSVIQPAKGTRNRYTEADDRILWNWVNENPQKGGGTDGNEIYKQLETKHPQHPWQSWRDRWIKHLKGTKTPFPLPHNAPPTPPSDVPPTTESSKNPATATDAAEDDYQSFSDDDAEALMVNGDDILNIHPDNITEAWESWTRDHDKENVHTAHRWQSYWKEKVRPRYLKRKAKETRRASPEKTVPARSPVSVLSMKSTAALPTRHSPNSKPHYSLNVKSTEQSWSVGVEEPVLPALKAGPKNRSYFSESPAMTATAPPLLQETKDNPSKQMLTLPFNVTPEKSRSPYGETLKRKYVSTEEDLPSSSPLGPISPKRRRPDRSELPVEILSTPEKRREPDFEGSSSPLVIKLELEEDETSIRNLDDSDSLIGQQLSETLSEPGHDVDETQAFFEAATPFINFDIPSLEGGWDNEDLLVPDSSQAVSFDIPRADHGNEDNEQDIKESTEFIDLDPVSPEGGWDDEPGPQIKEGSEFPNAAIYDPQPTLPETQAILQSTTPAPDFSIPDPDGGWDNLIASSPPAIPSSPRAESVFSDTDLKEQMDAWIDAHAIRGISVEQVESVLKSTSMDTRLAHRALRHLAKKGDVPSNRRGVWTASDDEDLKSTDARKIQRLQEKHGADCLTARWEFLDYYAEEV